MKKIKYLFKISYLGYKFNGFEIQEIGNTIENYLFNALVKVKLIESIDKINEHDFCKCGRTDKGVSAAGNYFSIFFNIKENYLNQNLVKRINSALPKEIRILNQQVVNDDFSARFDCTSREYRYVITQKDLDFVKMDEACKYLIGIHDFRNFCKINVNYVKSFIREIFECEIIQEANSIKYLKIRGSGFLWHMVRCIMSLLYSIGYGHESPEIIKDLLDIEANPNRPAYN